MIRTHEAGSLRGEHAGETVVLAGWVARRRDHGGVVFIDLRDATGTAQVVLAQRGRGRARPARGVLRQGDRRGPGAPGRATRTPSCRPARSRSSRPTLEVLSEADPLPFPIEGTADVNEEVRIKYRYLDIRREEMSRALRVRSTASYLLSRRDARPRLRQRGDPVPDPVHARGRARLPGPGPAPARATGTPCRSRRSCSSSCSWSPASSATTSSPAASATRTPARTGSRSSPRSTSRCRSSTSEDVIAVGEAIVSTALERDRRATRSRCRCRG